MQQLFCSLAGALRRSAQVSALAAAAAWLTPAAAVQLPTADQGHFRLESFLTLSEIEHFEFVTSMDVKSLSCCGGAANAFVGERAYAFFAIPDTIDLSGSVVLRFNASLSGPAPTVLTLQEIFSPLAPFQSNYAGDDATGSGLFIDLGNGPVYATTAVAAGASSFALALNNDARSRIDASRGDFFGIGFTSDLSSVDNPMTLSAMVLDIAPVPEPATLGLMLAGLALLGGLRLRGATPHG